MLIKYSGKYVRIYFNMKITYFIFFSGLVAVGESLGLKLLPPRKKINVMLMGNHSAGKSSFINW